MEAFFLPIILGLLSKYSGWVAYIFNYIGDLSRSLLKVNIVPVAAVTSVGVSLTSLFFCMEMFSQLAEFRMERIEDAIRIGMKFVVAKVVIENSSAIVGGISAIFNKTTSLYVAEMAKDLVSGVSGITIAEKAGGLLGIAYLLLFLGVAGIGIVIMFFLLKIAITLVGIAFEMGIHQAIAPIALSTLCNSTARSTGIAFIKSYSAVCLQLTVITAIFQVFLNIQATISKFNLNGDTLGIFSCLVKFIPTLICVIALSKAVKSAMELTKRMFGV